jgi:hypothetical protein
MLRVANPDGLVIDAEEVEGLIQPVVFLSSNHGITLQGDRTLICTLMRPAEIKAGFN